MTEVRVPYTDPPPVSLRLYIGPCAALQNILSKLHRAGIDGTLATVFGWPLAALQHGVLRAMFTDVGIDIHNIDGYTDGVLSHKYAHTTPTKHAVTTGQLTPTRACGKGPSTLGGHDSPPSCTVQSIWIEGGSA